MPSKMSVKETPFVTPELYHAQHESYQEDIPYWLGLAENASGGVLELGCGTGRVLLPLVAAGVDAVGLDRRVDMLDFLQKRLKDGGFSGVELVASDMTDFHLMRRFDLILLPCNTYSTLSANERRSALRCIGEHMHPGGRFAASMSNPSRLTALDTASEPQLEAHFRHPVSGNPVQVSSSWRRREKELELTWYYDHLLPDGRVMRSTQRVRHYLDDLETYRNELHDSGFVLEQIFGDFSGEDYSQQTDYAVFSAVWGG